MLKGFGNSKVQSCGSVKLDISIDDVSANVSCRVVCDEFLEKSMLVGQSFSEQPHVVVLKDSQRLRFLYIGAEMPCLTPSYGNVQSLERVRVTAHCNLYGAASVRATTETSFAGYQNCLGYQNCGQTK